MKLRYALLLLPLLTACRPEPPSTERPPEPKATALRDTMQQPLDRAHAADAAVQQAARARDAALDVATDTLAETAKQ
jgi:hypothetical protein